MLAGSVLPKKKSSKKYFSLYIVYGCFCMCTLAVFSQRKDQGMIKGHGVGEACSYNKPLGLSDSPHQMEFSIKACWADMLYAIRLRLHAVISQSSASELDIQTPT